MKALSQTVPPEPSAPQAPKELTLKERIGAKPPDGSVSHLNAIIYGEPSAGKTFFFGTCEEWPEEFLPALLIDIDGGWDTIRWRKGIDISPPVRNLDKLKEIYRELAAEPDYYKCVGLDNISELQKIDMNEVMVEAKRTANNPDNVDIYVPSPREWGKSGERMRIIIRAFRDLPCHTICLAHMDEKEDRRTKFERIWPGMPGKLRHELAGFFSVVGFISVYEENGEVYRQIQFKKTRTVQARDRFQVLPDLMSQNPTLPQVWKIIKDSGARIIEDDPLQVNQVSQADTLQALKGAINS